jgi:hypothetical protein
MNTAKRIGELFSICLVGSALSLTLVQVAAAAPGDESGLNWEQTQLFNPSQALLLAEAKGRVTIYDGLYHTDVDRAMDQQFGRIDRMMFVRTKHRTDSGYVMEDDDCD